MIYIIIGCLIITGILSICLLRKNNIDKSEIKKYQDELQLVREQWQDYNIKYNAVRYAVQAEQEKLDKCNQDLQKAFDAYNEVTEKLDSSIQEERARRYDELDKLFSAEKEKMNLSYEAYIQTLRQQVDDVQQQTNESIAAMNATQQNALIEMRKERAKLQSLLEPLQQYEKEIQEKLFYTIQLPEEYQSDIEFLLTTVAAQVQHPDIISKLVWNEYVKNYLAETCKRVNITDNAGIYKLTSLTNGKCYIGKSTNVKKRIQDHFKSVVGITSIADQAVHHAIRKEGFWNWTIEVITYCDKEELNELERYYIEFFKSQEYGYNKNAGGGG